MSYKNNLPFPVLDALPLGARRLVALTDEALFESVGVRIAFTGREGGVSVAPYASLNCADHVGDDLESVQHNRRILCEAAGVAEAPLVVPKQVHGTDLVWASDADTSPMADGVLSKEPGIAVIMNFADCLSLVVVAPTGAFAVVHAGWRGALAHIASKAVRELVASAGVSPGECNAYIGPHIRSECYEVGGDVEKRFRDEFGEAALAGPGHISLAGAVCADLMAAGFDSNRIADCGVCTKCHSDTYFSYRATIDTVGRYGCNAAFAARLPI